MDDEPVDVTAWTQERIAARTARVDRRRSWLARANAEHLEARRHGLERRQARRLRLAEEDERGTRRVRVEGDLFHGRVPDGAVYVGRAAPGLPRSAYANPYRVGREARNAGHAVELYRAWLLGQPELVEAAAEDIGQSDVACWCPLDQPCHGDVLLRAIDALRGDGGGERA